jgi:cytochrome c5
MKTLLNSLLAGVLALSFSFGIAQATVSSPAGPKSPAKPKPAKKPVAAMPEDPGERAFATHCSRCHNAPESLRPSMTGTVVRHMRVRANLSAEDERLIRGFLAP